jgi:hypothetical protein
MNMKKLTLKKMLFTAAMLIAAGQAVVAAAHDRNDSLGAAASAVDYVTVSCTSVNNHHLLLAIDDVPGQANPPDGIQMSVLVQKGNLAASATAPDGGISPTITLAGSPGNGVYNVFISKTAGGSGIYHLLYHCETASAVHTATSLSEKQNQ